MEEIAGGIIILFVFLLLFLTFLYFLSRKPYSKQQKKDKKWFPPSNKISDFEYSFRRGKHPLMSKDFANVLPSLDKKEYLDNSNYVLEVFNTIFPKRDNDPVNLLDGGYLYIPFSEYDEHNMRQEFEIKRSGAPLSLIIEGGRCCSDFNSRFVITASLDAKPHFPAALHGQWGSSVHKLEVTITIDKPVGKVDILMSFESIRGAVLMRFKQTFPAKRYSEIYNKTILENKDTSAGSLSICEIIENEGNLSLCEEVEGGLSIVVGETNATQGSG